MPPSEPKLPLVRGVNDDPGVWAEMWTDQVRLGMAPFLHVSWTDQLGLTATTL